MAEQDDIWIREYEYEYEYEYELYSFRRPWPIKKGVCTIIHSNTYQMKGKNKLKKGRVSHVLQQHNIIKSLM